MNRKYAAWITHVEHHRISLLLGEFSGFSFEAQYAVAYVARLRLSASPDMPRSRMGIPGSLRRPFIPVGKQGFGRSLLKRKGFRFSVLSPVADVLCQSAPVKDQFGSLPSPGGAQTRQTEIITANYTTSSRLAARSTQSMS